MIWPHSPVITQPAESSGYQTVGDTEFTQQEIDYPALLRLDVGDLEECQTECSNIPESHGRRQGWIGRPKMAGERAFVNYEQS